MLRRRGISLNPGFSENGKDGAPASAQRAAPPAERKLDLQIIFAFDSDRLTPEGMEVLDQLGEALGSEQLDYVRRITLEGHTDATGAAAYNQDLSHRRAERARDYLSRFATDGRTIRAIGKGAREPADPANPEAAINRRVRIIVDG